MKTAERVVPIRRQSFLLRSTRQRDERTYAHYSKWCQAIGITPLDFDQWQSHTAAHRFVEQIAHVLSDPLDR
jgi:hypothetical protein